MDVERLSIYLNDVRDGDAISATVDLDKVQTPGVIDEENQFEGFPIGQVEVYLKDCTSTSRRRDGLRKRVCRMDHSEAVAATLAEVYKDCVCELCSELINVWIAATRENEVSPVIRFCKVIGHR